MKKLFALILALLMALSCLSALADTVYTKVSIDPEVAKGVLSGFGMEDDQLAMVDPVAALVNALGVKVITVDDGAQIDLDLNGTDALSLGFAADDAGINVASTLFQNYLVTISQETITQMMEQFAANMPAGGSGEGGFDATAFQEMFAKYYEPFMEVVTSAGQPGEAVTGEYEFDGVVYDTYVPVTIDVDAIKAAAKDMMDQIMADPAAVGMIKGYVQGMSQSTGEEFNEETFEADFKAGFEEWIAHIPAEMTVDFYAHSDGSEDFYMTASPELEEGTMFFDMTMNGENMKMNFTMTVDGEEMACVFAMEDGTVTMSFEMSGMYMGMVMSFAENQFAMDIYFLNADAPLVSVTVESAEGGERTLSMDAEGKTVLAAEELMQDMNSEAAQGLFGDIMGNGLGTLMGALSEQVPEVAGLLSGGAAMAG